MHRKEKDQMIFFTCAVLFSHRGFRTIAPLPNPKTNPNPTLNPNWGTIFLGETAWLSPNTKTNPNIDPNPNLNRGAILLAGWGGAIARIPV